MTRTRPSTRCLFGFDFVDDVDHARTVDSIVGPQPIDDCLPLVVTPNVDDLVRLAEATNVVLAEAERQARYVLPDGQPIVWCSRLAGRPLAARLPGSHLFPSVWRRLVDGRRRVVVVASSQEVVQRLQGELPTAGFEVPPFFAPDDVDVLAEVVRSCAEAVRRRSAEFLIVGIGFPKQQLLALGVLEDLRRTSTPPPLILLLGGSLNMYVGLVRPAPKWIQRIGVEFLFRFFLEPRRLFRRYFVTDLKFAPLACREVAKARREDRGGRARDRAKQGAA